MAFFHVRNDFLSDAKQKNFSISHFKTAIQMEYHHHQHHRWTHLARSPTIILQRRLVTIVN